MLEVLIDVSDPNSVSLRDTGVILTPSDNPLEPGHYDIRSNNPGGDRFLSPSIGKMSTLTQEQYLSRMKVA
ncbi:hypothetical protein V1520DRAFT_346057 [Lipomyces starkeyi]